MATTASASPRACLLGIPVELRLHIYDHVFRHCREDQRWVTYHIHDHVYDLSSSGTQYCNPEAGQPTSPGSLGMLRTCCQVYEEASNLLFASTTTTVCIRAPNTKAWSTSSLSLGLVKDMRLWRFVRDLNLTVEMECNTNVTMLLSRISSFVEALDFGIGLRQLNIVLKFGEDEAWPKHIEDVVKLLSHMQVHGVVSVRFDEDVEDAESRKVTRLLTESIATQHKHCDEVGPSI